MIKKFDLNTIHSYSTDGIHWEYRPNKDDILEKINELIDAVNAFEQKHGRWIEHHEPFSWMGYTTWTCSECDYEVGYEKDIKNRTNYCPNCGAKMDERSNER